MAVRNAFENLAVESKQDSIITALGNLLTELQQKYEGGAIALDAATLAALETITASISNWPVDYPLPVAQIGTLTPQKDALTDAELRATPVPVSTGLTTQTDALTNTQLRATPVPVSGSMDVTGEVRVNPSVDEERYEFDAAGNPLYVGVAPDGSDPTSPLWTVARFTFSGGLPTRKQVRQQVAWSDRATLVW